MFVKSLQLCHAYTTPTSRLTRLLTAQAPYTEYFCRHTTLGEVGSSLAHFEAAVSAADSGCDVSVIFEDDARPSSAAMPALFAQIDSLEAVGVAWDLIYIASSKYDREVEAEAGAEVGAQTRAGADGGAEGGAEGGAKVRDGDGAGIEGGLDGGEKAPLKLLVAGHRKVCAAYALSKAGAHKIARCSTRWDYVICSGRS